jgi:acyl-CoA thioester hydrolase
METIMPPEHHIKVQVYYEDTDHSGVVYHANYLRYFERAREHLLGVEHLVELYKNQGIGFVVYKADLTYKKGAEFGDNITIVTSLQLESEYRLIFHQNAILTNDQSPLVIGKIELVCVGPNRTLTRLPSIVMEKLQEKNFI